MANERLRSSMVTARLTRHDVAARVGVNPKTVQRWLAGRRPYERHQWIVAKVLDEDPDYLWPPPGVEAASGDTATHEVAAAYPHRAAVPPASWWHHLSQAEGRIDLLGYAMLHLPEQHPQLMALLTDKARAACRIRIALADPESQPARQRDEEERLDGGLLARIRTSTKYFGELIDVPGVELRRHATPMYNSTFRFDDHMFVTPHLHGVRGASAPLLHLRCRGPEGVFAKFVAHFEDIWAISTPITEI